MEYANSPFFSLQVSKSQSLSGVLSMVSFRSCSRVIMASCFWSLYEVQSFLGLCQRSQYWCASTPLPHALLLLVSPSAAAGACPRHHLLLPLRQPQLVQAQAIAGGTIDQWFSLLSIGDGNVQYRNDAIFWCFFLYLKGEKSLVTLTMATSTMVSDVSEKCKTMCE